MSHFTSGGTKQGKYKYTDKLSAKACMFILCAYLCAYGLYAEIIYLDTKWKMVRLLLNLGIDDLGNI